MEARLREPVESKLGDKQTAFTSKRKTRDTIFILKNEIKKERYEEGLFLIVINLKSAFDTAKKRKMRRILDDMEVPNKL